MNVTLVVFILLLILISFMIGRSTKKEGLMSQAYGLPNVLFTVIYSDKMCTVLRECTPRKRYFLVSTEVFAGKPIRAKDTVRYTSGVDEMQRLQIPIPMPHDVLVKDNN